MTGTPLTGATSELGDLLDSEHAELPGRLIAWRDAAVAAERERGTPSSDSLRSIGEARRLLGEWDADYRASRGPGWLARPDGILAGQVRALLSVLDEIAPKGEGE